MAKKKYIKRLAKEVGIEPSSLDNWTSEDIDNPVYSKTDYTSGAQKRRDEEYIKGLQRARNENFINTVVPAAELGMSLSPAGDIMDAASMVDAANKGNYGEAALYGLGVLPFVSGKAIKKIVDKSTDIKNRVGVFIRGIEYALSDKKYGDRPLRESLGALVASPEKMELLKQNLKSFANDGANYVMDYYEDPTTLRKVLKNRVSERQFRNTKEYEDYIKWVDFQDDEGIKKIFISDLDQIDFDNFNLIPNKNKRSFGTYRDKEINVHYTHGPYVRQGISVGATAAHETNHLYQDILDFSYFNSRLVDKFNKLAVDDPKGYYNQLSELHSALIQSKYLLQMSPTEKITVYNIDRIIDANPALKRFFVDVDSNKKDIADLMNELPSSIALPAIAGSAAVGSIMSEEESEQMKKGGVVMGKKYIKRLSEENTKGGNMNSKEIQQSFAGGAGQKFIQDLINAGLDMNSAIAIAANAWQESRLQPYATNPESGAYGLFQWLGPRKKALFKKYGKKGQDGKEYVSYEDQMKYFLEDELPSATAWLGKSKRDAFHDTNKDVYEKTFLFLKDFERPGDFDEEGRRRARFAYEIGRTLSGDMTEFDEGKYPGYFTDTTRINVKPLEEEPQQQIPSAIERQGRIVEENIQANQNISPSKIANEIKSTNFATRSGNPEPIEVQDAATQLLADIEGEKMRTDFLQAVVDNIQLNPVRQTRDKKTKLFIGFGF